MAKGRRSNYSERNRATFGFEATFWINANKLRINMNATWNNLNELDYGDISQ